MYFKLLYFTGSSISGIVDEVMRQYSEVHDLHITGDTLTVPRLEECKVLYLKLN